MESSLPPPDIAGLLLEENLIGRDVLWVQVERQKAKMDLDSRPFSIARFRRGKAQHYHESSSPTPTASNMRGVLANTAVEDWELRYDVEQVYLQADIDAKIYD